MLKQLSIIVLILAISNMLESGFDLFIPASIIGMLILLILLLTKVIKLGQIEDVSNILQKDILLFLIPSTVGIMEKYRLFEGKFLLIILICIISTIISFFATAIIMKLLLRKKNLKGGY